MKQIQLQCLVALCLFATAAATASAAVLYVDVNSTSPTPPYTDWATAAVTIQDAVDAAVAGDQILVTNGIYRTGGNVAARVVVDKLLSLRSVKGPQFTAIKGGGRCVVLTNGASLSGFTLTNGTTLQDGGGVWCQSTNSIITNCVVAGNSAYRGGGAFSGTLINCTLAGNLAFSEGDGGYGGGAYESTLYNCTLTGNSAIEATEMSGVGGLGGGARHSTLNDCTLAGNSASSGGGVENGTLNNCTLNGNSAGYGGGGVSESTLNNCTLADNFGGGAVSSTLNNCTLTGNFAYLYGGGASHSALNNCTLIGNSTWWQGGGAFESTLNNCIVYDNIYSFPIDGAYTDNYGSSTLNFCCTTPLPALGIGNTTNAPLFVNQAGGNLRLHSNSPCINAGNNSYAVGGTDLDGRPRIVDGSVDIGAYEFQPGVSGLFLGWLQQYGLPTDGSADYSDSDIDRMNNWQEWIAGTAPTDALSVLRLLNPSNDVSGVTLSWQSVSSRTYFLERASNLGAAPPFLLLRSNIAGQAGTTSYTDTNAIGPGPFFYRVGVQ